LDDEERPLPGDGPTAADPPSAVPAEPAPSTPAPPTPAPPSGTPSSGWVGTSGPADGSVPLPPPSTDSTGQRLGRIALAVGVIALLAIGSFVVRGALSNVFTSEHERAATEAGERILAMPEFKARYGNVDSADRAFDIGQELVASALPRLSAPELDQYWQATARFLDVADPEVCGKILRQEASNEEAESAAKELDIDSWRTLLSMTVVAIERELRGVEADPPPTEAELNDAYVALAGQMGESEMQATGTTMGDPAASNAEVCDAGQRFLAGVLALPETPKQAILRFMVSP
jgi:hypothetical protein